MFVSSCTHGLYGYVVLQCRSNQQTKLKTLVMLLRPKEIPGTVNTGFFYFCMVQKGRNRIVL